MKYVPLSMLLVLSLPGCATRQPIMTAEAGTMPTPAGFRMLHGGSEPSDQEQALAAKLEASGFSQNENARLLVQISLSEPSAKTGLSVAPTSEPQWLVTPTTSKSKRMRRLVVTITDGGTGEEVYRAFGTERYRRGKSDKGDITLRESVFSLLPGS